MPRINKKIYLIFSFLIICSLIWLDSNYNSLNRTSLSKGIYIINSFIEENFYAADFSESILFLNRTSQVNFKCAMANLDHNQPLSLYYLNKDREKLKYLLNECLDDKETHYLNEALKIDYLNLSLIRIELSSNLIKNEFSVGEFECEFRRFQKKLNQSEELNGIENLGPNFMLNKENNYRIEIDTNSTGFYHLKCHSQFLIHKSLLFEYVYTIYPLNMSHLIQTSLTRKKIFNEFVSKFVDQSKFRDKEFNCKKKTDGLKKMNVLMLGIDSVSRNQFKRIFKETDKYLESKPDEYVSFEHLNSVGMNTYPNILAMLTGLAEEDNHELNIKSEIDYYRKIDSTFHDHLPFIWNEYEKSGYLTMYQEDCPSLSIFNYFKKGFRYLPTHLYGRALWMNYYDLKTGPDKCHLNKPTYQTWFEQVEQFLSHMNEHNSQIPYFSFNFLTEYTHNYLAISDNLDLKLKEFLDRLDSKGYLDNTLLILFGDHGNRLAYYAYATEVGKLEKWLPFLSIRLPKALRNSVYDYNLRENKNKLISFFDLYQTMRHFLFMQSDLNSEACRKEFSRNDFTVRNLRGVSLLERVSENRSCADALIPAEYCTCLNSEVLKTEERFVKESGETFRAMGEMIVPRINELTEHVRQLCYLYKFKKIQRVRKLFKEGRKMFKVVVLVEPGEAWFEVSLIRSENGLEIDGGIKRLSPYGDTSRCMSDPILLNFCFCKK